MAIATTMALAIAPRPKSRENGWELNRPLVVYLDGERPPGSFIRTERTPGLDRSVAMAIAIFMALAIAPRPKSRENGLGIEPAPGRLSGRREPPPGSFIRAERTPPDRPWSYTDGPLM